MKSIGPHEILANGTRVAVNAMRGEVVGHKVWDNGVVVHEIQIDTKRVRVFGNNYKDQPFRKKLNPNYSFVYVI